MKQQLTLLNPFLKPGLEFFATVRRQALKPGKLDAGFFAPAFPQEVFDPDLPGFDPRVVQWGQKHAIRAVPLGVYEDVIGPPSYLLNREADVTVLLSLKQRVVANFAFRAGELNEAAVRDVLASLIQLVAQKK